jgi:hypothetical protein
MRKLFGSFGRAIRNFSRREVLYAVREKAKYFF